MNLRHNFFLYFYVYLKTMLNNSMKKKKITLLWGHNASFFIFLFRILHSPFRASTSHALKKKKKSLFPFQFPEVMGNVVIALGLRRFHNYYLINQRSYCIAFTERKSCHSFLFVLKMEKKDLFDIFWRSRLTGCFRCFIRAV